MQAKRNITSWWDIREHKTVITVKTVNTWVTLIFQRHYQSAVDAWTADVCVFPGKENCSNLNILMSTKNVMDLINLFQVIYLLLILLLSSLQRLEEEISWTKTKGKRWFCLCLGVDICIIYSKQSGCNHTFRKDFGIFPFNFILLHFRNSLYF